MDDKLPPSDVPRPVYRKQTSTELATKPSEVQLASTVRNNVQYTPFHTHASLARARSDDPWGIKHEQQQVPAIHVEQTIAEEDSDASSTAPSSSLRNSLQQQQIYSISNSQLLLQTRQIRSESYRSARSAHSARTPSHSVTQPVVVPKHANCCGRINVDWLFFIKPIGILMVLEIGMCAIAVICSDYSSLFQGVWKTWFFMLNWTTIMLTSVLFLLHLWRFGREDFRVKMIFLFLEIIYNVVMSLALMTSAVAYLRVSVDPNTNRSYSLSIVIIAGVCGIISSIMYGISAFFTFTARRNCKYNAATPTRRQRLSSWSRMQDWDDEEYERFNMSSAGAIAQPPVPAKRIGDLSKSSSGHPSQVAQKL